MSAAVAPVEALGVELVVARARLAARQGRLDEAETQLRGIDDLDSQPAALDLLARVHAQRGELDAADACWVRVQAIEPAAQDAAAGRRLIARIRAGEQRARPLLDPGRTAVAAVALVAIVAAALLAWPRSSDPALPPPAIDSGVAVAAPPPPEPEVDRAAAVHALAERLAMPGVRVDERPGQVRVVFDGGLFARSDQLSPAGAALLERYGSRLTGLRSPITVVGHTVAVSGGPASGGSVVAMARALVAARELARSSGLPLTAFVLASADQADVPFPDAARNRTVTIQIEP